MAIDDLKYSQFGVASSKMINSFGETVNILGAISNSIKTIDSSVEAIYDGKKFWAGTKVYVGTTTADETVYILGITSAKRTLMSARSIQTVSLADISVQVNLFEDVATSTNSGNITSFNMNRNITSVGTFAINDAPATITASGTLLPPANIIRSATNLGHNVVMAYNYEMKNNTKYAIKIVNQGTATAILTFFWTWSEYDA